MFGLTDLQGMPCLEEREAKYLLSSQTLGSLQTVVVM